MTSIIKLLFIISFGAFLNSCSDGKFLPSSFSSSFPPLIDLLSKDNNKINRDVVNAIPYASSLITFDGQQKSLIILVSQEGSVNTWISADKIIFEEENGLIIRTIGLPNDLSKRLIPRRYDFSKILKNQQHNQIYYSFRKPTLNNLRVESYSKLIGKESVSILGHDQELILIEEDIYSKKINWRRTNKYWIDPESYFVWKSLQHLSPRLPPLVIEVTKKPAM